MELTLPPTLTPDSVGALLRAVHDAETSVTLVGGCAGLDLEALSRGDLEAPAATLTAMSVLLERLVHGPQLVFAHLTEDVSGGGMLVAAADFVVADASVRFALPELVMGLAPSTVLPVVERRIGPARARRLAVGPAIDAATALDWGLIDSLDLDDLRRVQKRSRRFCPNAVAALRAPRPALPHTATIALLPGAVARVRRFLDGDVPWDAPCE